jgi:hypothetical protein
MLHWWEGHSLKKLDIELPSCPTIPLLAIYISKKIENMSI